MKVSYNGQMIECQEVDVLSSNERWNEYQLANGDVLQIKLVLIKALKADTVKSPDGQVLYSVNTQAVVKVREVGSQE